MAPRQFAARPRRTSRAPRLATLALLLGLPACYTWRPVSITPARQFGSRATVRVERVDQSRVFFIGPRVVDDSLVGVQEAPSSVGRNLNTKTLGAIALADVHRAQERRISPSRTALGVVGFTAVVLAIFAAASDPSDGEWTCRKPCSW